MVVNEGTLTALINEFAEELHQEAEGLVIPLQEIWIQGVELSVGAASGFTQQAELERLGKIADLRASMDDHVAYQVALVRLLGASWQQVAEQLGLTRQAAQQRYREATDMDTEEAQRLQRQRNLLEAELNYRKAKFEAEYSELDEQAQAKLLEDFMDSIVKWKDTRLALAEELAAVAKRGARSPKTTPSS